MTDIAPNYPIAGNYPTNEGPQDNRAQSSVAQYADREVITLSCKHSCPIRPYLPMLPSLGFNTKTVPLTLVLENGGGQTMVKWKLADFNKAVGEAAARAVEEYSKNAALLRWQKAPRPREVRVWAREAQDTAKRKYGLKEVPYALQAIGKTTRKHTPVIITIKSDKHAVDLSEEEIGRQLWEQMGERNLQRDHPTFQMYKRAVSKWVREAGKSSAFAAYKIAVSQALKRATSIAEFQRRLDKKAASKLCIWHLDEVVAADIRALIDKYLDDALRYYVRRIPGYNESHEFMSGQRVLEIFRYENNYKEKAEKMHLLCEGASRKHTGDFKEEEHKGVARLNTFTLSRFFSEMNIAARDFRTESDAMGKGKAYVPLRKTSLPRPVYEEALGEAQTLEDFVRLLRRDGLATRKWSDFSDDDKQLVRQLADDFFVKKHSDLEEKARGLGGAFVEELKEHTRKFREEIEKPDSVFTVAALISNDWGERNVRLGKALKTLKTPGGEYSPARFKGCEDMTFRYCSRSNQETIKAYLDRINSELAKMEGKLGGHRFQQAIEDMKQLSEGFLPRSRMTIGELIAGAEHVRKLCSNASSKMKPSERS